MVQVGTRRTAFYINVPPGSYTFRVIASNNDGVWNTEGATIRVTVLPPFWLTRWFLALVTIVVAGLLLLLYHHGLSQLKDERALQVVMEVRSICDPSKPFDLGPPETWIASFP